jgi:6-phosphogluconolactonase (cycloisomerase 2 family)
VYAINSGNNTIAEYSVGGFGSLTFNGTVAVANAPFGVTIDSSGRFLYVIGTNNVYGYTINQSTGLLTAMSGGASLATIAIASSVTVDPTGRFLIVGAIGPSEIYVFTINPSTGIPTNVTGSPFSSVLGDNIAVDPTGQFLYVVGGNHTGSFYVRVYGIAASTGALTLVNTLIPSSFATGVAVEPYGRYAYVCLGGSAVNAYSIDPGTGNLFSVGSVAAGSAPSSVAVDIQGQYVYVTNKSSNTVSAYSIDQNTGALTEITGAGSPFAAGTSPGSVVIGGVIQ